MPGEVESFKVLQVSLADLRSKVKKKKLMKKGNKSQIWGEGEEKEKSRKRVKNSFQVWFIVAKEAKRKTKQTKN